MQLKDKSVINAVMCLSSSGETMYNIRNIIVSGSHKVQYDGEFINVSDIKSIKFEDENQKYKKTEIYCLDTSSKKIVLNDLVFRIGMRFLQRTLNILNIRDIFPKKRPLNT